MTNKLSRLLLCVVLMGLTSVWALAQDENANSKSDVRNITGCLSKSGTGDEYLLTASDGSTWEMHANDAVDLANHVSQTVEVKGVVSHDKSHNMKEDMKQMGHDAGMKNNTAEHGHLTPTDVRKVGLSCER